MSVSIKNNFYCVEPPEKLKQKCPLCGEIHPAMLKGLVADMETGEMKVSYDKGYSFCNCHNIFYTKYENIDKKIYDKSYYEKYKSSFVDDIALSEILKYIKIFKHYRTDFKSFLEIGAIHDIVLDEIKKLGVKTTGLDIINHDSNHEFVNADFESFETDRKFDIIHASHIFEHFKDPIKELLKCKRMLNDKGLLYVAMPDTFVIDFDNHNELQFDWNVSEHHILWGMESFIEMCENNGLICVHSERSYDLYDKCQNKFFWKQDFKVILSND